ncbi:hypothetical protein NA78x_000805 [Anatilimnocola sp. NA78]|uniref:hypothetical protein n=1 Tax=Anatilimnocola sp. NA78 TaxID=3415683 RepID=UPI003CE58570
MKLLERATIAALVLIGLFVAYDVFKVESTSHYFSPDTLRFCWQADSLIPWPATEYDSKVITFLVAERHVERMETNSPRWRLIARYSPAWRDGQGPLVYVFSWRQDRTIAWCKEDPERARLLWSTVFPLLRSNDPAEVKLGENIARMGLYTESFEELKQQIDEVFLAESVHRTSPSQN